MTSLGISDFTESLYQQRHRALFRQRREQHQWRQVRARLARGKSKRSPMRRVSVPARFWHLYVSGATHCASQRFAGNLTRPELCRQVPLAGVAELLAGDPPKSKAGGNYARASNSDSEGDAALSGVNYRRVIRAARARI